MARTEASSTSQWRTGSIHSVSYSAELLLEADQPAAALSEFETALKQTPNRYRALLGVARAAKAAGDRQKAAEHYDRLVNLTKERRH